MLSISYRLSFLKKMTNGSMKHYLFLDKQIYMPIEKLWKTELWGPTSSPSSVPFPINKSSSVDLISGHLRDGSSKYILKPHHPNFCHYVKTLCEQPAAVDLTLSRRSMSALYQ